MKAVFVCFKVSNNPKQKNKTKKTPNVAVMDACDIH